MNPHGHLTGTGSDPIRGELARLDLDLARVKTARPLPSKGAAESYAAAVMVGLTELEVHAVRVAVAQAYASGFQAGATKRETDEHPASWLDCSDCRALSKAGAEPPRCDVFLAKDKA